MASNYKYGSHNWRHCLNVFLGHLYCQLRMVHLYSFRANRYTVYTKSKSYAKNVAAFVLAKSKQAFRKIRKEKNLEAESEQNQ